MSGVSASRIAAHATTRPSFHDPPVGVARGQMQVVQDDRHGDRQRRAARNADQVGVGQRIAEQPLHDGAGYRQRGADDRRDVSAYTGNAHRSRSTGRARA